MAYRRQGGQGGNYRRQLSGRSRGARVAAGRCRAADLASTRPQPQPQPHPHPHPHRDGHARARQEQGKQGRRRRRRRRFQEHVGEGRLRPGWVRHCHRRDGPRHHATFHATPHAMYTMLRCPRPEARCQPAAARGGAPTAPQRGCLHPSPATLPPPPAPRTFPPSLAHFQTTAPRIPTRASARRRRRRSG